MPTEEESPDASRTAVTEPNSFLVSWINASGEEETGPLDLLWHLIETYRVDIFDISLFRITEDFLSFIRHAEDLKIELVSSFAVMAARLLYYKSKALLPDPGFDEPDTEDRLPPELIQQLLEYRRFQMAADKIRELDHITSGMYIRESNYRVEKPSQDDWLDVSVMDLIRAYGEILKRVEGVEDHSMELQSEEFSTEEKVEMIRNLLSSAVSFLFEDLFENIQIMQRGEIVATFLAILELVKSGEILVRQKEVFGSIHIFKKSASVH